MATSGSFDIDWDSGNWAGRPKCYEWRGNWTRTSSGITLSGMQVRMYMRSSTHTGSGTGTDTMWIEPGGSSQSVSMTWSGRYTNWASLNNVSVNLSASATSQQFGLMILGETDGYVTLYFDAAQSAPNTPTCTVNLLLGDPFIGWSCSNLGIPSGSVSLYGDTSSNPSTLLDTKNTTDLGFYTHSAADRNTEYFYKSVATNSVGSRSSSVVSAISGPAGLTSLTVTDLTSTSVTLSAVFKPSGNALTVSTECQINGSGTWDDLGITNPQGTTQPITIGPLQPETNYTIAIRTTTTSGTQLYPLSVSFVTPPPVKFYGSVNDETKLIKKLYGSVNGDTKLIKKLYGSVNGETKLIYQG